ncbi:glutathione S-transferase family protein [Streptomyces sp. NPDC005438]|uniref:glutathione S-transferase family protein n=1 Tax=Streptomyces sp. NPDC005438 TaxID=3156880 RepID=UPI0033BC44EF
MSATPRTTVPSLRGRIGRDRRSGHYPVPHRYRLHLSPSCPECLRVAITHELLDLSEVLPVHWLPAVPDAPGEGYTALVPLYEASWHHHPGPATAPVLSDGWTGRIVSDHLPDILVDLAHQFGDQRPELYPEAAEPLLRTVDRLCADGLEDAAQRAGQADVGPLQRAEALDQLLCSMDELTGLLGERRLLWGSEPVAADIRLWVALLRLDLVHRWHLDALAVHHLAEYADLWAYARRLAALPAFRAHLDVETITRRHHAQCRGLEAAGAAVRIVRWPERRSRSSVPSS